MISPKGVSLSQREQIDHIVSARMVSDSALKLICELEVELTFRGASHLVHGRFTIQRFPNGRSFRRWQPGY